MREILDRQAGSGNDRRRSLPKSDNKSRGLRGFPDYRGMFFDSESQQRCRNCGKGKLPHLLEPPGKLDGGCLIFRASHATEIIVMKTPHITTTVRYAERIIDVLRFFRGFVDEDGGTELS